MPLTKNQIIQCLEKSFPKDAIDIQDTQNNGYHFHISIVSEQFQNKSTIEQHQIVYQALKDFMGTSKDDIHAITLQTSSP